MAVREIWTHGRRVERVCYVLGLVLIASGAFHFALFLIRGGPWEGPVSWRKPTTFGLSFGLTLIAVAWVASSLKLSERTRALALGVFAADCFVEVGGITLQAWRHVPSHIDMQGSFNTGVSMTLAVGGGILVLVLGRLAFTAFRGDPDQAPSMRLALRAGFATLMIGLLSGAAMIARGTSEAKTGHQQQAYQRPRLPQAGPRDQPARRAGPPHARLGADPDVLAGAEADADGRAGRLRLRTRHRRGAGLRPRDDVTKTHP